MSTRSNWTRIAAVAGALLLPPALAYALNPLMPQTGLDIVSVAFIEVTAFASGAAILRPRLRNMALAALLYFPLMFVVLFLIGYRGGYYDLP